MYLNKATIIGNITRDPEIKSLPSGMSVCSLSVATNRVWRDKSGERNESTDFHNVVIFGKQAESVAQYMKKGSQVLVEGRLQTRSWEKDGEKKYRTEIVADRVQFGNRSKSVGEAVKEVNEKKQGAVPLPEGVEYPTEDIAPEDIPF